MNFADILSSTSGLGDITIGIISLIVIVWLISKFLDKQQEQIMLHNEQMDKTFKIIANFTETLSELVSLIREGNEKTDNVSDKVDEINRKLEKFNDRSLDKNKHIDEVKGDEHEN